MAMVVTIGRDVQGEPMSDEAWVYFVEAVRDAVKNACGDIYFTGYGYGWSDQWGREDAWTIIAEPPLGPRRGDLVNTLSQVRAAFDQEAVAVTFGDTYFA